MPRKSKQQMQAERNQVERLLRQGIEDKEIMQQLGLTREVFYNCKHRIYKDEADIFRRQTIDDIAFHSCVLHSRLRRLLSIAERKLESIDTKDFAPTLAQAKEISINIWELETQGIRVASSEFNRNIHRIESKELVSELPQQPEPEPIN